MKKKNLIIGGVVLGLIALYFYNKKQQELKALSLPTTNDIIGDVVTSAVNTVTGTTRPFESGDVIVVNESRADLTNCYTSNLGEYCCVNQRTGDITCTPLTR